MKVAAVYVRFFRAFNFNFIRKNKENAKPNPWDDYDGLFFPYVKIPLDTEVTSVVGANESGKSQLLYGIECALGIETASPDAFCRYSQFFTVNDKLKTPHFGLELLLDEPERGTLAKALGAPVPKRVFVFREQPGQVQLYLGRNADPIDRASSDPAIAALLPKSFRIHPKKPLPNTVPLEFLVRHASQAGTEGDVVNRKSRVTASRSSSPSSAGFAASSPLPSSQDQTSQHTCPTEPRRQQPLTTSHSGSWPTTC